MIKSEFGKIKGSKFLLPSDVPADHYLHSRVQVCSGVPALRELDWLNWVPNAAHLFFSPISPTKGKDASLIHSTITKLHKKWGFDVFPTMVSLLLDTQSYGDHITNPNSPTNHSVWQGAKCTTSPT
jgi:hypothetical protein